MRPGVAFALSTLVAGCLFTRDQADWLSLEPGKPRQCNLPVGQTQGYTVSMEAHQYARVSIAQRTVNVAVAVLNPAGGRHLSLDNYPIGDDEEVEWIAEIAGTYRLQITASETKAPAGQYEISLVTVAPETERHRHRVAAAREVAEATAASRRSTRESMFESLRHYQAARSHWQAAQDPAEESRTLCAMAFLYIELGERDKASSHAAQALPLARAAGDNRLLGRALDCVGEVYNNFSEKKTAIDNYLQALPLLQAAGDRAGEAKTLNNLGVAYLGAGEKNMALDYFDRSMRILKVLQDRSTMAQVASNIGVTYDNLGDYRLSLENLRQALALRRELGDRAAEALTQNNIGSTYSGLGEYQKALDAYLAALEIHRANDSRWNMAVNLNNIGWVYAALGDRHRALNAYQESLELSRAIQDPRRTSVTLNNIANIHSELGDYRKAIELHTEVLGLRRQTKDLDGEATSLTNLGEAQAKLNETEKAREHFERAAAILRASGNRYKLLRALRGLGMVDRNSRDFDRSRTSLDEALKISRDIRDRNGEATVLAEMAQLDFDREDLPAAHRLAEQALAAFETLRLDVISPNLRASLVASTRRVDELNVETLQRLHLAQPENGFDAAAFLAAEHARARSLLELLGESAVEIRRGVDSALLARERELQLSIADKADRQTRLLNRTHTPEEAVAAARELDGLCTDLEQVQSRIRETSPQYAALTRPEAVSMPQIQRQILDENTVLFEYELGAARSYLWAITATSIASFELPPRAEIESAAMQLYELLTARNQTIRSEMPAYRAARIRKSDQDCFIAAARLSHMLLSPAAERIVGKRILIVAEGALQYVPFAVLPEPGGEGPLMIQHEIVTTPSASVLAVLRQETANRQPAARTLFVAADPVYSADDPRVPRPPIQPAAEAAEDQFPRLRFSRAEAEQIARLVPPGSATTAFDFEANRASLLRADLTRFRILHFATHGLLDDERPELSGIVLSRVDRSGRAEDGVVRLYDIYNLRLNADLVVLSACRTALGPEIKGEGLIGLTRGFFYAGAKTVAASLWQIDDRTAAAFMRPFYEALLLRHETPPAALRSAQLAMWRNKGWDAPYYWAAFTVQGEWR